jgi:hypothetical protein
MFYDLVAVTCVAGIATRLPRLLGATWFFDQFTPMDNAVLAAALLVSFVLALARCDARRELYPRLKWMGRYYVAFYMSRNVLYLGFAYLYLVKAAEVVMHGLGVATTVPVDALKVIVFVALLRYATLRIVKGAKEFIRRGQAGGLYPSPH